MSQLDHWQHASIYSILVDWLDNHLRRTDLFHGIATCDGHKNMPHRHPNIVSITDHRLRMFYLEIYHCVCVEFKVSAAEVPRWVHFGESQTFYSSNPQ